MASQSVSANAQAWLKERFGTNQKVIFSKQTSLTNSQWMKLAEAVQAHVDECREIYLSADSPEVGLERLAAVLAIHGVMPISPEVVKASSMVMKLLKGN